MLGRELVGQLTGAIRRAIVDDEQLCRSVGEHRLGDNRQIVALVVGRYQHQSAHGLSCGDRSNRSVAICSETKPTRNTMTANISRNTAPLGIRDCRTTLPTPYTIPSTNAP